ncbi:MAG: hypothetical protein ACXWJ6_10545 [Xanthobacteraceae bacterium]
MRCSISGATAVALALLAAAANAQSVSVEAINASEPTQCVEKDNVYIKFVSSEVRRFTVDATHPAYLRKLTADNKEPDFHNCDMARDPAFQFTPRQVTLYDGAKWRLLGFVYPNFWRGSQVPVRVGDHVECGLHLLQLWTKDRVRNEEVLVLYPADGYWRARPLAPQRLGWEVDPLLPTAYGSSFLIGPIEQEGRPFVDLNGIAFVPDAGGFLLNFVRGGTATVRIHRLDTDHISLDVKFSRTYVAPFAAFRSMYVSDLDADAARVAWRRSGARHRRASTIDGFRQAQISEFWLGRTRPSRHNTSAPNFTIGNFRAGSLKATSAESGSTP